MGLAREILGRPQFQIQIFFIRRTIISKEKESSYEFNVLAFTFEGEDTTKETVKDIKSSGLLNDSAIIAEVIVTQDEMGKVHIHEPGHGNLGAVVGGVAGKYLGRPIKKGDLEEVGESMVLNNSAFLLLVEDIYSEAIADSLSGVNANMITLTVGDELSGELAQFVAGEISASDYGGDGNDD